MEHIHKFNVNNNKKHSMRFLLSTFFIASLMLLFSPTSFGQDDGYLCEAEVIGTDTVATVYFPAVDVRANRRHKRKFDRRHNRLERKVVKVYPYAKAAGELMRSFDEELAKIEGEQERKKFVKYAEEELKNQFEGDLRDMTISEGVILIKLIDRETGASSYNLIQELKGDFSAFMWQGVARLFSHNLKDEYDPYTDIDDEVIEYIIDKIEFGFIQVEHKDVVSLTAEMFKKD